MVRTARGRFLYTGRSDGGGVYKTAYRATIPKRAKLTTRGNSQVLALHKLWEKVHGRPPPPPTQENEVLDESADAAN
jgi:hypothetical protein